MKMDTLWLNRKPGPFLTKSGASSFKIIHTGKGKRKLIGYFENWEACRKAIESPQAFLPLGAD
jgi:hypothetical protein